MTDRLRTSPLNTDHLLNHHAHGRIPDHATRLANSPYAFGVEQRHLVVNDKPDEDSSAYIVCEVETSRVDFENADMAEDALRVFLCHCKGFHYHAWPEDITLETPPMEIGSCKHTERVKASENRVAESGQASLGVTSDD